MSLLPEDWHKARCPLCSKPYNNLFLLTWPPPPCPICKAMAQFVAGYLINDVLADLGFGEHSGLTNQDMLRVFKSY